MQKNNFLILKKLKKAESNQLWTQFTPDNQRNGVMSRENESFKKVTGGGEGGGQEKICQ